MTCPRCQQKTPPSAAFCPTCGASVAPAAQRQSPTSLQPTLRAIARTAARLCEARDAQIFLLEGETLCLVGQHGSLRTAQRPGEPFRLSNRTVSGRAVLERRVIHVRDLKAVVRTQYPDLVVHQRGVGVRTILVAPLVAKGAAMGVILIRRLRVRPFTRKQIALLKTFADQATMAIENARLLNETKEMLEQKSATGDILRVISSSPTDVQPVFDAIAQSGRRLCDGNFCAVAQYDGELLHLVAHAQIASEGVEAMTRLLTTRPGRGMAMTRAVVDRATV